MKEQHKFDVKKIIDDLCGAENPSSLTQKHKVELIVDRINDVSAEEIQVRGVEKWIDKGMISGPRLIDLGNVAAKMGVYFNMYKYMTDNDGNPVYKV